jgi:hypothetical protein
MEWRTKEEEGRKLYTSTRLSLFIQRKSQKLTGWRNIGFLCWNML